MKIGQPGHLKSAVNGGGLNRTRLQEGENIHRIIYGPVKVSYVYYPTLIEDRETGEMKQQMKVLKRPPGGTPIDVLASLDKRIRREKGEKQPRSSLSPANKWLYLVINKEAEDYPAVKVAEYPFKVYEALIALESAVSRNDANKLRHGLIFMYEVIIKKKIDHTKPIQFGTSYSVEVDPENPYTGVVPVSYLGLTGVELEKRLENRGGLKKFFTEEEWSAIQDNIIELENEGQPDSQEDMNDKLAEFPPFLGATDAGGSYRFPDIEAFKDQLEGLGISFLLGEGDAREKPKSRKLDDSEETFGEGMETEDAEDAEFEVVEDGKEKTEKEEPEASAEEFPENDKEPEKPEKPEGDEEPEKPKETSDEEEDEPDW